MDSCLSTMGTMSTRPHAIVVTAPGINCDLELAEAFELAGAAASRVHVNALAADPSILESADLIGLPGGFSYGDAIAAGRILAVVLQSTIIDGLRSAIDRGVPMVAPCNGFQIAAQAGLLPGPWPDGPAKTETALLENDGGRFVDRWVRVEYPESKCVWTQDLVGDDATMVLPIAHGEGRFHADASVLARLECEGRIAVRYAENDNPNGSQGHIAGICDDTGLVLGLMPHPERYLHWTQHPCWTRRAMQSGDPPGLQMFRRAVRHVLQSAAAPA